jgi:hypothetical protein
MQDHPALDLASPLARRILPKAAVQEPPKLVLRDGLHVIQLLHHLGEEVPREVAIDRRLASDELQLAAKIGLELAADLLQYHDVGWPPVASGHFVLSCQWLTMIHGT